MLPLHKQIPKLANVVGKIEIFFTGTFLLDKFCSVYIKLRDTLVIVSKIIQDWPVKHCSNRKIQIS